MNVPFDEPTIPCGLRRPLAAIWISFGLHAALIALVQVASPGTQGGGGTVIEARLEQVEVAPPVAATSTLAPAEADTALPATEVVPPAAPPVVTETEAPGSAGTPATSPAAISSPVDLTYYSTREVDVPPRALHDIVPDYPEAAEREALSGKVRLHLKLDVDGRVSDVEVIGADPPGLFEESARAAFAAARFSPAYRGGKPVRVQMMIEVEYGLENHPE
ncbi:MAG: TonB family protein [Thiobacillus sp.]|nr:TonB family protein [Thiobacillus sp.]